MGVFRRGSKLWITYKDVDGAWKNKPTGLDVGQEELARAAYDEVARRVRDATSAASSAPGLSSTLTVRGFVEDPWIPQRRALDLDWKNDESRLRTHVLPVIGDLRIADVRTRHIVDLFRRIRTTVLESTGEVPSARLVYNCYSVVAALFRDAKLADRIEQTPCCLDERQLGPLRDKDPEWRAGAVFDRAEVRTLISSPLIPADRQLVYALELLAGVRTGEAAALRWEHYDRDADPLGRLLVAVSYNTRKNRQKGTKTGTSKHVPVHPTLAAMLAEWRLSGWAAMVGRAPTPDDLIVPLPPDAVARRRTRDGEPFRGHDYSGKRWREEDLPALGWRHRRHYDMRATFITLALEDGADPDIVESRITHTKKSRSAFSGYDRGERWAQTCREVLKLRITRLDSDEIAASIAVGAGGLLTSPLQSAEAMMVADENGGGGGSRTRAGEHATPSGGPQSHTLTIVRPSPSRAESHPDVRTPLQVGASSSEQPRISGDAIARALDDAGEAWRETADRRVLRRALMRLLVEIEEP